jgi:hypothetical protein
LAIALVLPIRRDEQVIALPLCPTLGRQLLTNSRREAGRWPYLFGCGQPQAEAGERGYAAEEAESSAEIAPGDDSSRSPMAIVHWLSDEAKAATKELMRKLKAAREHGDHRK